MLGLALVLLVSAARGADHASIQARNVSSEHSIHGNVSTAVSSGAREPLQSAIQEALPGPEPSSSTAWPIQHSTNGVSTLYSSELYECWTRWSSLT